MDEGQDRLRWWQYLGPWPLAPVVVGMTVWLTAAIFEIARSTAAEADITLVDYLPILAAGLPAAFAAGLVMWLFSRSCTGQAPTLARYWLALLTTVVVFVGIRFGMGLLPRPGSGSTALALFSGTLRTMVMIVFIQTVIGVSGHRLSRQVRKTNEALRLVRDQQEQMLEADEQRRAQVSMLLHDRVQAGLIAACLELQDCADRAEPGLQREIAEVVHRLEDLRGLDVRRAARSLSPDLGETDLHSAIDDLVAQYARSMRITVSVAAPIVARATRPPAQLLLGAYRIVEQSLLNAAVHGRARQCAVDIDLRDHGIVVTIDDDGSGMAMAPVSGGVGTALMTTWVRILDGHWSRSTSPMGGVRVQATLPLPDVPTA